MKRTLLVLALSAIILCLTLSTVLAEAPLIHLTFDGGEEDYTLNGGAVVEDGVLKLPGGDMRTAYVELPYGALIDVGDEATISVWMYVPSETTVNSYFISFANGNNWPAFFGCVMPSGQVAIDFDYRGIMMTEPCFPLDAWTHITVTVSTTQMKVFLNGQRVAMYDGENGVEENCFWNKINGAIPGTTHFQELDKVSLPSGWLGTPPYVAYYDLNGDTMGMFDEYRLYDTALTDEAVAELYASLAVPAAAYPIGAAAVEAPQASQITVPTVPEDGLRVLYTFDGSDEGYTLVNGAKVEDGVLKLPGGAFREAGHLQLPENAIANCGKAMTVGTWINLANGADRGDQFIYAISAGDGWPALFLMVWGDGTLHYNIDYRSMLNLDTPMVLDQWAYLTAVLSDTEVTIYVNGEKLGGYDKNTLTTENGSWEMLNVQNDSTHFADLDRIGNHTFRVGTAFMDVGYNRIDAMAQYDNFRIYSVALTAEDVAALYQQECAETGYAN